MAARTPPNILLIMVDQLRADHLGCLPGARCATPHIDRIARRGCAFSRAVTPNPICQPARTALLTGRYPHQINLTAMNGDLRPDVRTVLQALQRAGYDTAIIGKLHFIQSTLPTKADFPRFREGQRRLGFDRIWEASGKERVNHHYCDYAALLDQAGILDAYQQFVAQAKYGGYQNDLPFAERWPPMRWPFADELYVDHVTGRIACEHLEQAASDRPFFLQVSFCGPHPPYDPPDTALAATPDDPIPDPVLPPGVHLDAAGRERLRANAHRYRAMIGIIDGWVGRLLDILDRRGLADATLIAFCTDHGEMLGDHLLWNKQVPQTASTRIPLLVAAPGSPGGLHHDGLVELTDLSTTILEAAGLDQRQALDAPGLSFHGRLPGRSLLPITLGQTSQPVRTCAFSASSGQWNMVETSDWKLVRWTPDAIGTRPREALFHLATDPGETHDRAADPACRDVLHDLRDRLLGILESSPPCQIRHDWGAGERLKDEG